MLNVFDNSIKILSVIRKILKIAVNLVCHMNNVVFSKFLAGFSRNLVFRKFSVTSFVRIYHKKNIFVGITLSQIFKMGNL